MDVTCHVATDGKEKTMSCSIFQVAHSCGIDWQYGKRLAEVGAAPMPLIVNGWLRWRRIGPRRLA